MTAIWFCLAAACGAVARHRVNGAGHDWVGTLALNVAGAFVLGWLMARTPGASTLTIVGTGFCGSLTTFSMFALEATEGTSRRRITVILCTLLAGLAAASAGHALG